MLFKIIFFQRPHIFLKIQIYVRKSSAQVLDRPILNNRDYVSTISLRMSWETYEAIIFESARLFMVFILYFLKFANSKITRGHIVSNCGKFKVGSTLVLTFLIEYWMSGMSWRIMYWTSRTWFDYLYFLRFFFFLRSLMGGRVKWPSFPFFL